MNPAHLADYFAKSGDEELLPGELLQNENGFMVFEIKGSTFYLLHMYGNGRYWQNLAERAARKAGCTEIIIGTYRNPETLTRKYGYKVMRHGVIMKKEL